MALIQNCKYCHFRNRTAIFRKIREWGKNDEMTAIIALGPKNFPVLQSTPSPWTLLFFRFSIKIFKQFGPLFFKFSTQAHSSSVIACLCPIFHPLALATNSIKLNENFSSLVLNFFLIFKKKLIYKKRYSKEEWIDSIELWTQSLSLVASIATVQIRNDLIKIVWSKIRKRWNAALRSLWKLRSSFEISDENTKVQDSR